MSDFYRNFGLDFYNAKRSILGFVLNILFLVWFSLGFYSLNVLTIPLIRMFPVMLRWALKNRWALFGFLTYGVLIGGLSMETYLETHYLAPMIGFNYLIALQAMRLWRWRNKRAGRIALWLLPFLCVVSMSSLLYGRMKQDDSTAWQRQRARINTQLQKLQGRHLIIVSYGPRHSFFEEWVYNGADIDRAKVIFARAMNTTQDCQLVEYFKSHRIWSLDVDGDQSIPELKPYPLSLCK